MIMTKKIPIQKTLLLVAALAGLLISPATAVAATTSNQDISQAVTQSYGADSSVQTGMMVKLKDKDFSSVVPLTQAGIQGMLGVVVSSNDAAVTLAPQKPTGQQVYVASYGRYSILVSNQNGAIKSGDYITISSVAGIGMKTDEKQPVIIGKAVEGFNGTSNVERRDTVKDQKGRSTQVAIGRIAVSLNIAHNPLEVVTVQYVPSFLGKMAQTVAGKPVSAARIYMGLIILLVSFLLTVSLLYGGIRSGMNAIGRNPLSKKSITTSLVQTIAAGVIIFVVGIFAVYLLLKL
jgi:hypothetical protein